MRYGEKPKLPGGESVHLFLESTTISTIFLGSYDILCQYALNLANILRVLVDIFNDKEVCITFRGGIC